jgi:hypothetical protein
MKYKIRTASSMYPSIDTAQHVSPQRLERLCVRGTRVADQLLGLPNVDNLAARYLDGHQMLFRGPAEQGSCCQTAYFRALTHEVTANQTL